MSGHVSLTMRDQSAPVSTGVGPDPELVDRRLVDLAVTVLPRSALAGRAVLVLGQVTSTPRGAAAVTTWLFSLAVGLASLVGRTSVGTTGRLGPAAARCGLDIYLYGYPDRAVTSACRHAETARLGLFVPTAAVVVAGLVYLSVLIWRRSDRPAPVLLARLRASRIQGPLVALGAIAAVAGAFALRPAPVELIGGGSLVTAHCGIDSYFGRYPDPTVAGVCRSAYAGRGHVVVAALILAGIGLTALFQVAYTGIGVGGRRRLVVGAVGGLCALGSLWGCWPVTVNITGGPTPVVANCGIDTYLAGYPDSAVQSVCRSVYAPHVALALAAGVLAMALVGWSLLAGYRSVGRSGDAGFLA